MRNHYIKLIEKIASESVKSKDILRDRHTTVTNKRTDAEDEFLKYHGLDTYQTGTKLDFDSKINLDSILDKKNTPAYHVKTVGKSRFGRDMKTLGFLPDIAREAAREKNREAEYDKTLDSIKDQIKKRKHFADNASNYLGLGGLALGTQLGIQLTKNKGALPTALAMIAGGAAGVPSGMKLGKKVENKIIDINNKKYFDSLEDYQREAIDQALTDRANEVSNNPHSGMSSVYYPTNNEK